MNKSIKSNISCTGCGVCVAVCPKNAIALSNNDKGFYRPIVYDNCVDCGLCVKRCHVNNSPGGQKIKKAYTAYSKNSQIRDESSSGGVFSELALRVINKGGFVCGAGFNEDFVLRHQIVSTIDELDNLRKSKYLESDISCVWDELKIRVVEKKVKGLFVGTPCQCASLRLFLGERAENLLICDFICHGVASPLVFDNYKKYLNDVYGAPKKIEFRHKENGAGSFFYYEGERGKYMIPNYSRSYPYAYASGLIIDDDCTNCRYCSLERFSDITLGDYVSGATDYSKSTIFANSQKGIDFLETGEGDLVIETEKLHEVINNSWHLTKPNTPNPQRQKVFGDISKPWDYLEKRYFHLPKRSEIIIDAIKNRFIKILHI